MCGDDLAQWIRKEHDEVTHLSEQLQEKVAIVPRMFTDLWLGEVRERFTEFANHLKKHMKLEEQDGYMSAITDRRPSMSRRVDRLAMEHRDFETMLDRLQLTINEATRENRLVVSDFCLRVRDLLAYIAHHEREENDLFEFVFTEDIGTKD